MYYVNPLTWWLRGELSSILPSAQVICAPQEVTYFTPPPGQTCGSYAGNFVDNIARAGYLVNPGASSECSYCPYKDGREYMHTLNVHDDDKWHCFGIFLAFVIINWLLVYFFIYTVRIRGWTFGMGYIFGLGGTVLGGLKRAVSGIFSKKQTRPEDNEKV
jgi:ABC-type multidrug transport system permease subunit